MGQLQILSFTTLSQFFLSSDQRSYVASFADSFPIFFGSQNSRLPPGQIVLMFAVTLSRGWSLRAVIKLMLVCFFLFEHSFGFMSKYSFCGVNEQVPGVEVIVCFFMRFNFRDADLFQNILELRSMTVGHRGRTSFFHPPLFLQEHGSNKIKRNNIKLCFKLNNNSYGNIEFDSSLLLFV